MERVIITGPTGTIGMALIRKCIEEGIHVLAIVNPDSLRKNILTVHPLLQVMEVDISEYSSLAVDGKYDVWFHLAWAGASGAGRNDLFLQNKNVTYLLEAVMAAKRAGCQTFVGAGSQAEYGCSGTPLSEDSPAFPTTGYGMAKLCAGQMGGMLCEQLGLRFIWPRIFSVYGPYDGENTMIMTAIRKLLDGYIPKFTKGEQEWDYLYCDDAAEMLYRLARRKTAGKIYCLGSGKTRRLSEYINIIRSQINPDAEIDMGGIPYSQDQLMYLCANSGHVQADTGFEEFTTFEEGIRQTINWLISARRDTVREKEIYEKNQCIDTVL